MIKLTKEVCAFNILQNNGYIKYSERTFERYLRDENGIVIRDKDNSKEFFIKINYTQFKAENNKIGEKLAESLREQGFCVVYEDSRKYRCYKAEDIRKAFDNLPDMEVFSIVECPSDIEEPIYEEIKQRNLKARMEYKYICGKDTLLIIITNLDVKEMRKKQEEKRAEEAIELIDKLFK